MEPCFALVALRLQELELLRVCASRITQNSQRIREPATAQRLLLPGRVIGEPETGLTAPRRDHTSPQGERAYERNPDDDSWTVARPAGSLRGREPQVSRCSDQEPQDGAREAARSQSGQGRRQVGD